MSVAARAALGVVLLGAYSAPAAAGWDPLKAAGQSLGDGAREALTPVISSTVQQVSTAGHGLIADVDTRIGARVDQVGGVATKLVTQVDASLGARVAQIDQSLEKRILQV